MSKLKEQSQSLNKISIRNVLSEFTKYFTKLYSINEDSTALDSFDSSDLLNKLQEDQVTMSILH